VRRRRTPSRTGYGLFFPSDTSFASVLVERIEVGKEFFPPSKIFIVRRSYPERGHALIEQVDAQESSRYQLRYHPATRLGIHGYEWLKMPLVINRNRDSRSALLVPASQ
jgi:hypothetical protein